VMNGPTFIDPAKAEAAKKAYQDSLAANNPGLIDADGNSHAANPFDTASDGSVSFNRWTDSNNTRSAQDTFFDDVEKKPNGRKTTVRRAAWQQVPEYYNDEGQGQFGYISQALKGLQGKGFQKMQDLYEKALNGIN